MGQILISQKNKKSLLMLSIGCFEKFLKQRMVFYPYICNTTNQLML